MKRLLVRLLFKSSPHHLDVVMTEDEATKFINQWKLESDARMSSLPHVGGYDQEQDRHWSVKRDDISAIFTINPEKVAADQKKLEEEKRKQEYERYQQQVAAQQQVAPHGVRRDPPPLYPPYQGGYGQG